MDQLDAHRQAAEMLKTIQAPTRFGLAGYGIVAVAFVLALINALLPAPIAFLAATLQPLIFLGLASLLYHIGQHVHVLHVNALRMMMREMPKVDDQP